VPSLTANSGPLRGRSYTIPEGEFTIGRSSKNHLWLDDLEVSRHHCTIATQGKVSEIRDQGSRNKTLVNGESIPVAVLRHKDEITIGSTVFTFSTAERPATRVDSGTHITELRPGDSKYLSGAGPLLSQRAQSDLQTLLRLSNLLHSVRDVARVGFANVNAAMQTRLESLLLDLFPADQAGVMASDADNDVVRQCCRRRVALQMRLPGDETKMVMAAPITVRGDVPAAIYLETSGTFDEQHLQFIAAVTEIAAVAWENASLINWLEEENQRLQEKSGLDHGLLGNSHHWVELRQQISRVADSDANVLIAGPTGSGKELVAHGIHRSSRRVNGPFVAINCASLPEALLESELFGYEKGAFTGAVARKVGRLEMGNGGTVFLDEIGELALPLQAKLLRVLESRCMERLGAIDTLSLDVRILAATNRDLQDEVRRGTFREDLFFRLKVVTLRTPALRDCPGDILLLSEHFARKCAQEIGRKLVGLSPGARAYLQAHSWPGNVRELKHAIESAVILGSAETLLAEDLPEQIRAVPPPDFQEGLYAHALETAKRDVILRAFEQSAQDHEEAANLLGLHPNYLHKLMRSLDLKSTKKRS